MFARTRDFPMLLRVNQLDILLAPTLSMIPLGGFLGAGGVGLWGVLAPLGALVFSDVRSAIRWFVAWLVIFLGSGTARRDPRPDPTADPGLVHDHDAGPQHRRSAARSSSPCSRSSPRSAARPWPRSERSRHERKDLLLNILPSSIADRLKVDTQTIADQFSSASILFADVVDFTPRSELLEPAEVVGLLDRLFSHFDALAERYGVEKIKTIGDAYMVAAGVPKPRPDHARALVSMGLDMVEAMHSSDEVGHLGLELRVGINSGPVVAGVIGRKRFLYDLWGDAVNTASRMESHGTPGRVQITRATYELVADDFECEPRGTIAVKGKGEMEIWHVLRRRPDALPQKSPAPVREADAVAGG